MSFQLEPKFIDQWKSKTAPFGFNGLGELVYLRTYSRLKPNGENEKWFEIITREREFPTGKAGASSFYKCIHGRL